MGRCANRLLENGVLAIVLLCKFVLLNDFGFRIDLGIAREGHPLMNFLLWSSGGTILYVDHISTVSSESPRERGLLGLFRIIHVWILWVWVSRTLFQNKTGIKSWKFRRYRMGQLELYPGESRPVLSLNLGCGLLRFTCKRKIRWGFIFECDFPRFRQNWATRR